MSRLDPSTPFAGLSPGLVLDAVEAAGLRADGRLFALNSYENRVYRVGIEAEGAAPPDDTVVPDCVIAKFYRAGRWSEAQIVEEHDFALELAAEELPVAAPVAIDGRTLHRHAGQRYALFECRRGGAPELDAAGARALLGRTLGRVHAVAGRRPFLRRPRLDDGDAGGAAVEAVLAGDLLEPTVQGSYERVARDCVAAIHSRLRAEPLREIRLHGDCHLGNLLWSGRGPVFVDLDDCVTGPAMQDLWMLVAGDAGQQQREWAELVEGYETFATFDFREVALIEALRTLRMIRHAAWLAARWNDPAFPPAFPWFAGRRYWETHVAELREQLELMDDPPLLRMR